MPGKTKIFFAIDPSSPFCLPTRLLKATGCLLGFWLVFGYCPSLAGQSLFRGVVVDSLTEDPLPFATVALRQYGRGTVTDSAGAFALPTAALPDTLFLTYLGYQSRLVPVGPQDADGSLLIRLQPVSISLGEVEVRSEKGRYRRKGNPAVALMRRVIEQKPANRPRSQPYYRYRKYEKVEMGLSNFGPGFTRSGLWKGYRFIFDYVDSTAFGEPVLPLYLQESSGTVFFRREPPYQAERREALQLTNVDDFIKGSSLSNAVSLLNQRIDVYEEKIRLFELDFISPIADIAPSFYRFYINDTLLYRQQECIQLDFVPNNRYNLGFSGSLYILHDSSYQVLAVEMGVLPTINLNFMRGLRIRQEFERSGGNWVLGRDVLQAEFVVGERLPGIVGRKTTIRSAHDFEPAAEPGAYRYRQRLVSLPGEMSRPEAYWDSIRPEPLSKRESGIYQMVDSLNRSRPFQRLVRLGKTLASGFWDAGPLRFGSLYSLLSYNPVEGWRTRLRVATNERFHPHWRLDGYLAYGFGDRRFKFGGALEYSFDPELTFNPRHFLKLSYQQDNEFPGQFISDLPRDNIAFSYALAPLDKMLAFSRYRLTYHKEFGRDFGMEVRLEHRQQRPVGNWSFRYYDELIDQEVERQDITTNTAQFSFFFAPNAKWWQSQYFRRLLPDRYPIFTFDYQLGLDGNWGREFTFHHLRLGLRKRFYLGAAGFATLEANAGKVWGQAIPFPLLYTPPANQTIAYTTRSFNLMNLIEFSADAYLSVLVEYQMNGLLLNKIPLIRALKFREVLGVKVLYGDLRAANNPEQDRSLIQFPLDAAGQPTTFALGRAPYVELSAGLSNILKVFRVDFVYRLTYRDHPAQFRLFGLRGAGIRVGLLLQI